MKDIGSKIRIIWFGIFIIGILCIALFPVRNRNLRLVLDLVDASPIREAFVTWEKGANVEGRLEDGQIIFDADAQQINGLEKITVNFRTDGNAFQIEQCTVYKDNINITKYDGQTLIHYLVDSDGFQSIEYQNARMECVTVREDSHFTFAGEFTGLLDDISSTFIEMRIIALLIWAAITIWVILGTTMLDSRIALKKQGIISNTRPVNVFKRFANDIKTYGYYMLYSAKSDLKAEVANSYLNWFWWLLEPFCNMLVYVVVFGNIMGNSIENYATFIFAALLMWSFFNKSINYSVKAVRNNRDIVTKVYIPKFILLLSNMFLNLFKLAFSLLVLIVMLAVFRIHISWTVLFSLLAYVELFLFSFGLGMIFLHFGVFIDDLSYAVGIALNMAMFLSGVFYNVMTDLPAPINRLMLWCNPVAMLIDAMREGLLYNRTPNLLLMGIWFVISVGLCGIGVSIVYKNENGYVKVV